MSKHEPEFIPYGKQDIDDDDIIAVTDVLRSAYLTTGPKVELFEDALCEATKSSHAIAMNSATSALHIAYLSLGLKAGDYLWTSPNTFVATSNAAYFCGAQVDFVDIDPQTYVMSAAALSKKLAATPADLIPKIVVPVHFAGQSADMEEIDALAKQYGFRVVEDASHAVGALYKGNPVGSCEFSDISIFSFHPVKIMTTAEGGAAFTNSAELAQRMREFRSHGITRDQKRMRGETHGGWYYQQIDLGYNYRITDLQSALGISQLNRLDSFLSQRRKLVARYNDLLSEFPLTTPYQNPKCSPSWHLYSIKLAPNIDRKLVYEAMHAKRIGVQVLYIPVHTQPYYLDQGFKADQFPISLDYYDRTLSLPLYATLSEAQQDRVVEALKTSIEEVKLL